MRLVASGEGNSRQNVVSSISAGKLQKESRKSEGSQLQRLFACQVLWILGTSASVRMPLSMVIISTITAVAIKGSGISY